MNRQTQSKQEIAPLAPGTGALCAEAQADGVPCHELGRDCQVCGRAMVRSERELTVLPKDLA